MDQSKKAVQRWTGLVQAHDNGGFVAYGDHLQAIAAAVAAERERCAKVCEAQEYSYWRSTDEQDFTPQDCADAIRRTA